MKKDIEQLCKDLAAYHGISKDEAAYRLKNGYPSEKSTPGEIISDSIESLSTAYKELGVEL
jgi:hypothetical protein